MHIPHVLEYSTVLGIVYTKRKMMKQLLALVIVLIILYIIAVEFDVMKREKMGGQDERKLSGDGPKLTAPADAKKKSSSVDRALAGPEALIGMSGIAKTAGAFGSETPGADDDFNEIPATHRDLDPEYVSSRERMGACGVLSKSRRNFGGEPDTTLLGTRNDDLFDGERAVNASKPGSQIRTRTAIAAIYGPAQAMGMHTVPGDAPSRESCTWLGGQGYMYDQSCQIDL
jgi:hypothetical protein